MRRPIRSAVGPLCAVALMHLVAVPLASAQALVQAEGFDPLALESAPVETVEKTAGKARMFFEGSIGNISRRFGLGSLDTRRAAFDVSYSARFATEFNFVFSDRIDIVHPTSIGADSTINSLREAYASWQPGGGNTIVDFGRINLRNGPGYGYNPTDFFRDGSLRVLTSADPFALRQNRIGTVMLRGQRLWNGGSLSVTYSPKLATKPSADGWSLDLGSTNNRDRALVTLGTKISQTVNLQLLLYKEAGLTPTVGANMTALLSDASTAHLEWSHGKETGLLSRVLALAAANVETRNRFVGGFTYTTLGKTSITAEYQYNGFGLKQSNWAALGAAPLVQLAYLREALRLQELAPRRALLIYVTQKSLWLKDLDLTAYLRFNPGDNSRLAWLELRHHWSNFDLTFQV